MTTLINQPSLPQPSRYNHPVSNFNKVFRESKAVNYGTSEFNALQNLDHQELLTSNALYSMSSGEIPNLWKQCMDLYSTFLTGNAPHSALQFLPVLRQGIQITAKEKERFINNPVTNHVLIQNLWLKVVLIHWRPGKYSSIHGHPSGGCVFKVLEGTLEEKRYSTAKNPELLSVSTCKKNSLAYIDDDLAYHAVGNPSNTSAISIHAYTPGIKQ